ncbi:MAG: hypothetical protein NVS3B14_02050 [Ktedonobacteraceae bacterium]
MRELHLDKDANTEDEAIPVLSEQVPVVMPELPAKLVINTSQQLKAFGDPLRARILGIIQQQPATAKQIADRLKASPGAIGHHLHVLEAARLAKVVARRFVRGTVANYYTRTARIFIFDLPREVKGNMSSGLNNMTQARDEMADALTGADDDPQLGDSILHLRVSPERANLYRERLQALVEDIMHEAPDPTGEVYSIFVAMFKSPDYLQVERPSTPSDLRETA